MDKQCEEMVWGDWSKHRCMRKAVVERDGKSYCKIHDPEYVLSLIPNDVREAVVSAYNGYCGWIILEKLMKKHGKKK